MAILKNLLVNGSTNHIGRNYSQTPALGTKDRQVATTEFVLDNCYKPPLLSFMWADHLLNDMSWLRADTFSWQDGTTYSSAYNELLAEYNDSASVEETEGSITFKRTPKGYKIALATQETAILTLYNTTGIAWYYILDTTNKRFKLPRMKHKYWKDQITIPVIGNGMTLGLTNGTQNGGLHQTSQGAVGGIYLESSPTLYGTNIGTASDGKLMSEPKTLGVTTDSSKSGIVADISNTIEETGFYLYFYVGEFSQTSLQQTAGLNAELFNGKADVDTPSIQAPYIKATYVNGTSGYNIWSNGYCEQWGSIPFTATGGWTAGTITFLKPFKDTNYHLNGRGNWSERTSSTFSVNSKTTTNFNVTVAINTLTSENGAWYACGYLAQGEY